MTANTLEAADYKHQNDYRPVFALTGPIHIAVLGGSNLAGLPSG
jgi:hypothetical protein